MGELYIRGIGVNQDYAKARQLIEGMTSKGFLPALLNLGFMKLRGIGYTKDGNMAKTIFEYLVSRCDPKAMVALGEMYVRGEVVRRNNREAFKLFNKAIKNDGDPNAYYYVGLMYSNGIGKKRDLDLGKQYLKMAWVEAQRKNLTLSTALEDVLGKPPK